MFIKIYCVVLFHSNLGLQWSMILYKYLFVRLTSSADLQPHLIEEEKESQQALQHHLSREQRPLFWQGLFISRFWLLAGVHLRRRCYCGAGVQHESEEEFGQGWGGQEVTIGLHGTTSQFACAQLWPALPKSLLIAIPEITHPHCASQMPPSCRLHLSWQRCSCDQLTICWFIFQGKLPSS